MTSEIFGISKLNLKLRTLKRQLNTIGNTEAKISIIKEIKKHLSTLFNIWKLYTE